MMSYKKKKFGVFNLDDPWRQPAEIWRNAGNNLSYPAMQKQVLLSVQLLGCSLPDPS